MYCTQCGLELRADDRFCSRCGKRTEMATPTASRPLLLDKQNKKIGGVCAGFARYFDADVSLMRVLWLAVALFTGGIGVIAYLAAWMIVPSDRGNQPQAAFAPHPQPY